MKKFGIDISRWQGDFDMQRAKAEGVEFVIVKGGGGDSGLYVDRQFATNYANAKRLGLPVGCYWFSKALSKAQAVQEANYFHEQCLNGRQFELPVYMDVENKAMLALGKRALTDIVKAFVDTLAAKGYMVGVYSSKSMFASYMHDDELSAYPHWIAQWATACTYTGEYGMWQFGGETNKLRSNQVAGVVCDQDYMLVDYPAIIKSQGLNGFKKVEVSKTATIKDLVALAESEVGYLEKASNAQLDDKTANAGSANWTKYARDLDNIAGFYNGRKNGYAWCDVFNDWLFVKTFGVEEAKRLLCQPAKSLGAGCNYSAQYYQAKGQWYKTPQVGDQIFFKSGSYAYAHTGLVVGVDATTVYTIEGNTSGASGVIANGGGVFKKSYPLSYANIVGYGRPAYTAAEKAEMPSTVTPTPTPVADKYLDMKVRQLKKGMTGNDVKTLQILLNGYNFACGSVDGDFGAKTEYALKQFQTKFKLGADGVAGNGTWTKLLSK